MPPPGKTIHGTVRGNVIEIDEDLGLPDGSGVVLQIESAQPPADSVRGEGIRRSAGAWADDAAALDEFITWNRGQRKLGRGNDRDARSPGE